MNYACGDSMKRQFKHLTIHICHWNVERSSLMEEKDEGEGKW